MIIVKLILILILQIASVNAQEVISSYDEKTIAVLNEELRSTRTLTKTLQAQVDGLVVDLTSEVSGILPIANGGTGQDTAQEAIDALLPSQTDNAGKVLTTNGTNVSWGAAGVASGTTILASATAVAGTSSTSYVQVKRIDIGRGGTLTVSFDMLSTDWGDQTVYARIYKNGSPFGTEQSTMSTTYVTKTETLSFSAGDTLSLYGKGAGSGRNLSVRNLYIKGDFTVVVD